VGNFKAQKESRQHQLLSTCMKLKNLCIKGKFKATSHLTIMEQLQIKAGQFRKQGRLQDQDLDKIIKEIKGDEGFRDGEDNDVAEAAAQNEQKRVLEVVKQGLLQVHGTAPNTKQQGIFQIMGENCNGLNNRIGGNEKIAKALDIKEDLDVNCLMYCKHCINFRHKDNKNNLKQMFQANSHARQFQHIMSMKLKLREGSKRAAQELSASASLLDVSRKPGKTAKA
jgi:hypothetical protein